VTSNWGRWERSTRVRYSHPTAHRPVDIAEPALFSDKQRPQHKCAKQYCCRANCVPLHGLPPTTRQVLPLSDDRRILSAVQLQPLDPQQKTAHSVSSVAAGSASHGPAEETRERRKRPSIGEDSMHVTSRFALRFCACAVPHQSKE
jgi:hypothetical protein